MTKRRDEPGALSTTRVLTTLVSVSIFLSIQGCTDADATPTQQTAGTSGTAGSAGESGSGGASATSGSAGTGGSAGVSGTSGIGGMGGSGGTGGRTPYDALLEQQEVTCMRHQECEPLAFGLLFGTVATCKLVQDRRVDRLVSRLDNTNFDVAFLDACTAALQAQSCPDVRAQLSPSECTSQPGKRNAGQSCIFSAECSMYRCDNPTGGCGVCADRVGAGSKCYQQVDCLAGLVCDFVAGRCVTPNLGDGETCDPLSGLGCQEALLCFKKHASDTIQVCQARNLPAGSPCSTGLDLCDRTAGVTCDGLSNTCVATQHVAAGATCELSTTKVVYCDQQDAYGNNTLLCREANGNKGTCIAPAEIGESCDGIPCQIGLVCGADDKLCALPSISCP